MPQEGPGTIANWPVDIAWQFEVLCDKNESHGAS